MLERIQEILAADLESAPPTLELGPSREGRPIPAFRLGRGGTRVSLIAGCHADEPVGPRLLRRLTAYLSSLPDDDSLVAEREWWIVPHANPDGEGRNRSWQAGEPEVYDLASYLTGAVRELPGDDVEFCFPRSPDDRVDGGSGPGPRPENRALYDWWRTPDGPFHLHASLHGMAFAAGPWFLLEPTWAERAVRLRHTLRERTHAMGYVLHDVERRGEKGFFRLERGFATRPDSRHMRDHFLARDDPDTARFRPSSMETIRSLGGDPLTLVSEVPLFLTPGVGETLGPPDPAAEEWKHQVAAWRRALEGDQDFPAVRKEARQYGLEAVPARDQMTLQWAMVVAGIRLVEESAELR